MNTLERILDAFPDEEFLTIDGFDDCVIGLDDYRKILIYSANKILKHLRDEMDQEGALEYFEYNVKSAYMGPQTPIIMESDFC